MVEQGVYVLAGGKLKGEKHGTPAEEEQEANAGSFVHVAGYFYGNIAAPFVFRLSEPQQSIDIRSILEATARIEIYGLEGSGALLLFRREWKITSRNLFSPSVKSATPLFIRGRDNFRTGGKKTTRLLTLSRRGNAETPNTSVRSAPTWFYGRFFRRSPDKRARAVRQREK